MSATVKTPWKDHLGDIPFTLEYFQGAMWEGVEIQAKERPNAVAMDFMGKSITYRELQKNIEACARSLRTIGIRPGDSVTIAMPKDLEFREELPKTMVGKVAYRVLEEEEAKKRAEAEAK